VADVFPPAAPRSLSAVATEKSVNLSWEANGEADLAGYLVLRSDRPDGPLEPLQTEVITETTWNDTSVKPGARYRYAVVAVDKATPPNRSGPSNEVEAGVR
jgi:fibronectin type 3 domain-containing protein